MEWLGWSFFRFTSPGGKVILTNPFIQGNPDAAVSLDDVTQADLVLVADGHPDEQGNAIQIAQRLGSKVMAPGELASWFIEMGVPAAQFPVRFANPGSRFRIRDRVWTKASLEQLSRWVGGHVLRYVWKA